jgi:hypothetical protein
MAHTAKSKSEFSGKLDFWTAPDILVHFFKACLLLIASGAFLPCECTFC